MTPFPLRTSLILAASLAAAGASAAGTADPSDRSDWFPFVIPNLASPGAPRAVFRRIGASERRPREAGEAAVLLHGDAAQRSKGVV